MVWLFEITGKRNRISEGDDWHYNLRGDVIVTTDDAGNVLSQSYYEAYGEHKDSGAMPSDKHRANTKVEDADTSLLLEGHRYRLIGAGIFLSPDPLEYVDGLHRYAYCGFNPWGRFDPTGLKIVFINETGRYDPYKKITPSEGFEQRAKNYLKDLAKADPRLKMAINDLKKSERIHYIAPTERNSSNDLVGVYGISDGIAHSSITFLNENQIDKNTGEKVDSRDILAHEFTGHAWERDTPGRGWTNEGNILTGQMKNEEQAVRTQNIWRESQRNLWENTNGKEGQNIPNRETYNGKPVEDPEPYYSNLTKEYEKRQNKDED